MEKEIENYNQLRNNVEKEVMKVYDQTASVDEVVINIFELFEHPKEDIIDCPSCGCKWNTTKCNSCRCGAEIKIQNK